MEKPKIYISLPITGRVEEAREIAKEKKRILEERGWKAVNPFDIYAGRDPSYFDYICCDLRALSDCQAVYFCKGWQKSDGCKLEYAFAKIYRKDKIFEEEINEKNFPDFSL